MTPRPLPLALLSTACFAAAALLFTLWFWMVFQ